MQNTSVAIANTSMNQPQAGPALRPLCRSLRYETQPREVRSNSTAPVSRSMLSQASAPGEGIER